MYSHQSETISWSVLPDGDGIFLSVGCVVNDFFVPCGYECHVGRVNGCLDGRGDSSLMINTKLSVKKLVMVLLSPSVRGVLCFIFAWKLHL